MSARLTFQLIQGLAASGKLNEPEVRDLLSVNAEIQAGLTSAHHALLEIQHELSIGYGDPHLRECLVCVSKSRHSLVRVSGIRPKQVTGGIQRTFRCQRCGSVRETVRNQNTGKNERHSYDHDVRYLVVLRLIESHQAAALFEAEDWYDELRDLADLHDIGVPEGMMVLI